jgi:hypothetical protein
MKPQNLLRNIKPVVLLLVLAPTCEELGVCHQTVLPGFVNNMEDVGRRIVVCDWPQAKE